MSHKKSPDTYLRITNHRKYYTSYVCSDDECDDYEGDFHEDEHDSSDSDSDSYDLDKVELGVKNEIRHHIKKYPELQNVICISLEIGYSERMHSKDDAKYDICYFYSQKEGRPSVRNKELYEKIKSVPLHGCVVYEEIDALKYAKYIDKIIETPRHICVGLDIPSIHAVRWYSTEHGYVVNFEFDTESG